MSTFRGGWGRGLQGQQIPATIGLVAAIALGFVLAWSSNFDLLRHLAFVPDDFAARPWTLFTYAFGDTRVVNVLFACLWLYGIGQVVERELGTAKFLIVWFAFVVMAALCWWMGTTIVGIGGPFLGSWVPIVAMTIIWATRYPNMEIMFMFVLRIAAKWVAWISVAILFFAYPPKLAPFVALPLAFAYFFAADMLPFRYGKSAVVKPTKRAARREEEYFDKVRDREQERQERERLRKLFESSLSDEDKKDQG